MKADFGCVLKRRDGLLRGGLAGHGRLWGAGEGSRQRSTRVLGWVLAGSVGFGERLGSSWAGSVVGLKGLRGAFGAIQKMYNNYRFSSSF